MKNEKKIEIENLQEIYERIEKEISQLRKKNKYYKLLREKIECLIFFDNKIKAINYIDEYFFNYLDNKIEDDPYNLKYLFDKLDLLKYIFKTISYDTDKESILEKIKETFDKIGFVLYGDNSILNKYNEYKKFIKDNL